MMTQHMMGCFEKLRHHFPPTSKLHEASWPGYPPGWQALWHGALWRMRLPDGTRRRASRPLMLAGYAELANLCSAEGDAYLTLAEASGRSKWLCAYGAGRDYQQLVAFLVAAEVEPVPGRAPWAAADVKNGVCMPYAPRAFGAEARSKRSRDAFLKYSGDGGKQLAAQLGLTGRPEWESSPAG